MLDIDSWLEQAQQAVAEAPSRAQLDQLKSRFLGSKSLLQQAFLDLKGHADIETKKQLGAALNRAKQQLEAGLAQRHLALLEQQVQQQSAVGRVDVSLPGRPAALGALHPLEQMSRTMTRLFAQMGFEVVEGPEIEDDFHNFTALNIPPNHPARSMQDTFHLAHSDYLLRTHTSPMQIRHLENHRPPCRIVVPGKVYRVDSDATHSPMFHQLEGLWVDESVSFTDMKGVISQFLAALFDRERLPVRFRSSFFPFTEPSAEVDMGCVFCSGAGCNVCSGTGFLEVMGCGMVDPNVLTGVGLDAERYQGFAFGMGIDRLAMLRYGINDIRDLYDNRWRFLAQYPG